MMKGRDLLGYTLNSMGGDKLVNMLAIAEAMGLIEGGSVASRAISLINPVNQYCLLEDIIVEAEGADEKLVDILKERDIEVPRRYGWKTTSYMNGEVRDTDSVEWYKDRNVCYRAMHERMMDLLESAIDCCVSPVTVTRLEDCITIETGTFKDEFELYEE
jgi:hypothetical protein